MIASLGSLPPAALLADALKKRFEEVWRNGGQRYPEMSPARLSRTQPFLRTSISSILFHRKKAAPGPSPRSRRRLRREFRPLRWNPSWIRVVSCRRVYVPISSCIIPPIIQPAESFVAETSRIDSPSLPFPQRPPPRAVCTLFLLCT